MKKQTKFLIISSSILTLFGILLPVSSFFDSKSNINTSNVTLNNSFSNYSQPVEINLSNSNYIITDFYNNCSSQFEAIKKNIETISIAYNNPILASDIIDVQPDFNNNLVNVVTNSQTIKLIGFNNNLLRPTNIKQPKSQNNIYPSRILVQLPIECRTWKMDDPSTWINCTAYGATIPNDINAKYDWLLNYITNYIYNNKPIIWDGVTYFNSPNLYIVENVGALMNASIRLRVLETNAQTFQLAINNSYNFKEIGSEFTDSQNGILRLSFYLKNYISKQVDYQTNAITYQLNTITNPTDIEKNEQQYINYRLDIELTGFFTPDNIKNSQKMGNEQIDILIIVWSSIGGSLLLALLFFIIYKLLLNVKYGKLKHE